MSRKGNGWDNAVAENFFKTIKVEFVYKNQFSTQYQAKLSLFNWIETCITEERNTQL
ncbi:MAG: IS3 family transposase [Draconibacterium sp.]